MADQVAAITADLSLFLEGEVIALTLDINSTLIENTPVDTGWAANNWVPSLNSVPANPPALAGDRANPGEVAAAAGRKAQGIGEVLGFKLDRDALIWVSNGVDYIQALNEGSSAKAPAAFVQASVEQAVGRANRRIRAR